MIKKVYYLSTCSTCTRILKEIQATEHEFVMQDIKKNPISEQALKTMKDMAGSYEALFSRRSMKYRAWNLHEKNLSEEDYKECILKEYTFLKRPVFIVGDDIYIGNSKKTVQEVIKRLSK